MHSNIGKRISLVRDVLNLGQDHIASFLGMSQSNVSAIELGRVSPNLFTICSLSIIFDIYIDWLVLGDGEDPKERQMCDSYRYFCEKCKEREALIPEKDIFIYLKNFSKRLKQQRKKLNLTQEDIKNKFGIARSSYVLIEKAESSVTSDVLEKLLTGMDVSGDWLLFGIEPYQKGVLFPREIYTYCKTEEDKNQLYKAKLENEAMKNAYKVYDLYLITKSGLIPHRNLTEEQLEPIVDEIMFIEGGNDKKIDVSKEIELFQNLLDRCKMKRKGREDKAKQEAFIKDLTDYFNK